MESGLLIIVEMMEPLCNRGQMLEGREIEIMITK